MGKLIRDETARLIADRLGDILQVMREKENKGVVYGFHINGNESDPYDAVTYIEDAAGMKPAGMDFENGVFSYGSWVDAFFMPRPCMLKFDGTVDYYLNPGNYKKKYGYDDPSDVGNDAYEGNAMMEWGRDGKKIWYKIVQDENDATSGSVYISDHQADGDYMCWSFVNTQDIIVDHFYTPIYNGWLDSNNRMRSLSGKTPTTGLTAQNERTYCKNNGTGRMWDSEVFCDVMLINLLLILIGKSLDTQAVFGMGATDGNMINTGAGDELSLFYGYNATNKIVKVFGMENWWGNVGRRFAGLIAFFNNYYYKLTYGTMDGSKITGYECSKHNDEINIDGRITAGAVQNTHLSGGTTPVYNIDPYGINFYIKKFRFQKWVLIPSTIEGEEGKYAPDFARVAMVNYSSGFNNIYTPWHGFSNEQVQVPSHHGALALTIDKLNDFTDVKVGVAPSCKPLA